MRVFVDQHLMLVRMHVWLLAIPREIVLMLVVLVVSMRMHVLHGLVHVLMLVPLAQMQPDP